MGGYYESDLKARLSRRAKAEGVSVSALVESILTLAVEKYPQNEKCDALCDSPVSSEQQAENNQRVVKIVKGMAKYPPLSRRKKG